MKKLLVLALVVVLTLSLAAVASASTFDPYVGGRIAWAYVSSDEDGFKDAPATYGQGSGLKMLLLGKIKDEATGTWGSIGAHINGWPADSGERQIANNVYDFGINNIAGSPVSIWYTNWENQNMKRGQGRIRDMNFGMYHEDPIFDHAPGNVIGIDIKTDNVTVNFGYCPNKGVTSEKDGYTDAAQKRVDDIKALGLPEVVEDELIGAIDADDSNFKTKDVVDATNQFLAAATFKFDGGDVHLGYWLAPDENTETNVGGVFKAGIVTISADYLQAAPKKGDSTDQIQVGANFDDLKLNVTVLSDNKYTFKTDGGLGYKVAYSGLLDGKFTIAYRALTASDEKDEGSNLTDFYIGYKYGIYETRLGVASKGTDNSGGVKDYTYASVYASFW